MEREPVAKVVLGEDTLLLDATGELFDRWDPSMRHVRTTLVGLQRSDLEEKPEDCRRLLLQAVKLSSLLRFDPRWKIREVGLNLDLGLRLALWEGPADIRFGHGDLKKRVRRLRLVLRHLAQRGRLNRTRWIDLRYSDRAIVKFKG
jgi:hypothetical protein